MCDQKQQKRLHGQLDFDLKVLNPWKAETEGRKWSRLFRYFFYSHASSVLIILTFTYYELASLAFPVIVENIATALTLLRSIVYMSLVVNFHGEYKVLVCKMFDDRTKLPSNQNEKLLTEAACKREFRGAVIFRGLFALVAFVLVHFYVHYSPNDYHLPFNCHILLLPPDGFLFAWEINYLFMTVIIVFIAIFFMAYVPLPMILMDQSSWLLDMALMTTRAMNEDLHLDDDIADRERVVKTDDHLKKFVERCEKIVEWQNEVQSLLKLNFNLEFQIQALILCLLIFFLSLDFFASFIVLNILLSCLLQLFVYCWMGTQVTNRFDQLSYEISKNWYLLPANQRKVVQMVLHWTQNMAGFTGTFKDVSMETFQSILEASYSFYTFLRTISG